MPTLEIERLTITARGRILVRDLSLVAAAGRLVWVTGDNGAGKSSLLRLLAGRARARSAVRLAPAPRAADIAYYAPDMGLPPHATVGGWLALHRSSSASRIELSDDDALLPAVVGSARLSRLSTGEAKRLLLWALLRTTRAFTFLDEPYEHLSPAAKDRLTAVLHARARTGVVVVATNQEVPDAARALVVTIDSP